MKKNYGVLLLLIILLTACVEQSKEGEDVSEVPTQEKSEENIKDLETEEVDYTPLKNILEQTIEEFLILGVPLFPDTSVKMDLELFQMSGLIYAQLLDFNGDGIDELYLLMNNEGDVSSVISNTRNMDRIIEEIWVLDVDGNNAKQIYSEDHSRSGCQVCVVNIEIIKGPENDVITHYQTITQHGVTAKCDEFIALDNANELQDVRYCHSNMPTYENDIEIPNHDYRRGDEAITVQQYEDGIGKFTGERTLIIHGDISQNSFMIGENDFIIKEVLAILSNDENEYTSLQSMKTYSLTEKEAIGQHFIDATMTIEGTPDEENPIITVHEATTLLTYVKEKTGKDVDIEVFELRSKEYIEEDFIAYENGKVYVMPYGY